MIVFNIDLVEQIVEVATSLLSPLGNRWLHVQGVVEKARHVGETFGREDCLYLLAAAYLHDVGYAPSLRKTGFHPLDGAYYVRSLGYDRLASLVAHHSGARFEARLRGYEAMLYEFPRECSAVADALTYCDLTTGPTGVNVSLRQRVSDVLRRYGETAIVSQSLQQAFPSVSLSVARTQQRLYRHGVESCASR